MSVQPTNNTARRLMKIVRQIALIGTVPIAWARSVANSRVLITGNSRNYMGFRPKNALNSLFYKTHWLNIRRYGRHGRSPIVGLGDYPLSRWIHISRLSHGLYANHGAATMLLGTVVWAGAHVVWVLDAPWWWVVPITAVVLFSTTTYAMAFVRQNYNILGWLWVPVALYATAHGHWLLAAAAWFGASLASLTVVFVAVPLMIVQSATLQQLSPLLSLVPALIKFSLHFVGPLRGGGIRRAVIGLARTIGLVPGGTAFRRASQRFGLRSGYLLFVYSMAPAFSWLLTREIPWLPITALTLYAVNQRFIRFADDQSVIILFLSVFAAHTLAQEPSIAAFVVLALVANPLPFVLGLVETDPVTGRRRIPVYAPYDHSRMIADCEALVGSAPEGSRILVAFDDPDGVYENIFDGYRTTLEPLLYAAARRHVHLFPDWHAISEMTVGGEFNIWGRTPETVKRNCLHWNAGYALLYVDSDAEIGPEWQKDFTCLGCFDFGSYLDDFGDGLPWSPSKPGIRYCLLSLRR